MVHDRCELRGQLSVGDKRNGRRGAVGNVSHDNEQYSGLSMYCGWKGWHAYEREVKE